MHVAETKRQVELKRHGTVVAVVWCIELALVSSYKLIMGVDHMNVGVDHMNVGVPYTLVNKRNSLLGAYWLLSAFFFPGFAPG